MTWPPPTLTALEVWKTSKRRKEAMYYLIKRDIANLWRWSFHAANHETIAVSSESYHNKSDCLNAIQLIKRSGDSPIHEN